MKSIKNYLSILLLLGFISIVSGQAISRQNKMKFHCQATNPGFQGKSQLTSSYSLAVSTGTYADLIGAISLNNNQLWDDPYYVFPIGFGFQLYDVSLDSIYIGMGLGGTVSSQVDTINLEADYIIMPFEADLIDRGELNGTSLSPISYKLEGVPGSRILKIEWKNAGFYGELEEYETLNDFVNFQLWLYEGSNKIEMHYGTSQITDAQINYEGESGAAVGLSDYLLTNTFLLSGSPANPTLVNSIDFLNGTPASGTIYSFTSGGVGIEEPGSQSPEVLAFPNPARDQVQMRIQNVVVQNGLLTISDSYGRIVKTISNIQTNEFLIRTDDLAQGVYSFSFVDQAKVPLTQSTAITVKIVVLP